MHLFLKQLFLYGISFWFLNLGLGYYLGTYETVDLQNKGQFYPMLRWEDYYKTSKNIDILILGSSHAYRAFDPKTIALEMNKNDYVFNFGSSAQSPVSSYYILQEVLKNHRPKQVVLDIYFMVFTVDNQLKNGRFNWSQMQEGIAKKDFFQNGFSFEEKVYLLLFPSFVYKDYLKNKFNKLLGRPYMLSGKGSYQGDGFVSNPDTLKIEKLKYENQFDLFKIEVEAITTRNLDYLKKIKDYCAIEKIPLIFTASPMPAISVEKIDSYTRFYQLFEKKAREWEVPFFDYNIHRITGLEDTFHYYDDDHLNAAGAILFSKAFSKDLSKLKGATKKY